MLKPHGAQLTVLEDASKYRVVIAPRMTGKTTLAALAASAEDGLTAYFTPLTLVNSAASTFNKIGAGNRAIMNPEEWKATGQAVKLFIVDEPSYFSVERIIELFRWAAGRRILFVGSPIKTGNLRDLDTLIVLYNLLWDDLSAYNWVVGEAGVPKVMVVSNG